MDKIEFANKLAVVTGASAGLGEEFARQLHARGCRLLLVARREERLSKLANELNAIRPGTVSYKVADLADYHTPNGIGLLLLQLRNLNVDILVNNAGFGSFGQFEGLPLSKEKEMVLTNALAPLKLTHAVIPGMKQRRSGSIIFVSSIAGMQPLPYMTTYAATKAFNLHQALGLRYELAQFDIGVTTVCPGPTATEFQGVSRMPGKLTSIQRDTAADVVRQAIRALERNQAVVVTGWRSKLISFLSRVLPWTLTTRIAARIMRGSLPGPAVERRDSSKATAPKEKPKLRTNERVSS